MDFAALAAQLPEIMGTTLRGMARDAKQRARKAAVRQGLVGPRRPKKLTLVSGITARVNLNRMTLSVGTRAPYGTVYNRGGTILQHRKNGVASWRVEARPYITANEMDQVIPAAEARLIRSFEHRLFSK